MPDVSKSARSEQVYCNKCRGETTHQIVATADGMADDQISSSTNFELLQCCGCQEAVLRRTFEYSIAGAPDYIIEEVAGTEFREVRRFPPASVRHPPKWRSNLPR